MGVPFRECLATCNGSCIWSGLGRSESTSDSPEFLSVL